MYFMLNAHITHYILRIWSSDTYVYCMYHFHIINVVAIMTQPMNVTVCLTQNTTASFICVVDRGGEDIFSAGWNILTGGQYVPVPDSGRPRRMVSRSLDEDTDTITDTLTVTNVSVSDNGILYRCEPTRIVASINVTITVLGMYLHNYMCMYINTMIVASTSIHASSLCLLVCIVCLFIALSKIYYTYLCIVAILFRCIRTLKFLNYILCTYVYNTYTYTNIYIYIYIYVYTSKCTCPIVQVHAYTYLPIDCYISIVYLPG